MSQKVLQRLILLGCSNSAQLQSYSPNPTLIFGMQLTHTANPAPWDENTQGHQTEATYLGEESNNSLPKAAWILKQELTKANTGKHVTQVSLEITSYLRFSTSVP